MSRIPHFSTRSVRPAAPPSVQTLYGATGFNAVNSIGTALAGGVAGSATTGLNVGVQVMWTSIPSGTEYLTARFAGLLGWSFTTSGANLTFTTLNGATSFSAPTRAIVSGDLNKVHTVYGVWDPAGFTRLYFDGVEVGSGTAAASYSPDGGSNRQGMGIRSNITSPFLSGNIYGMCGGNQVPSGAEIAAAWVLDKANAALSTIAGKTEKKWTVGFGVVPPNVPTTLPDQIGSDNITTYSGTGSASLTLVTTSPVVWG